MKKLIIFLCITLSFTSISFFKLGQAEFTLFHALAIITSFCLSLIAFINMNLVIRKPRFYFLAAFYLCAVNFYYIDQIKVTSFIFSLVILIETLLLYNCVKKLDTTEIKTIFKSIIFIYFVNIIVASGFIWLKVKPPGFLSEIFRIYDFNSRIRPYGFSDEPSYAALILVFSLFVLLKTNKFLYRSPDWTWYFVCILTIFLTGSSYGLILLVLLLLYFVLKSKAFVLQAGELFRSKVVKGWQFIAVLLFVLVPVIIAVNKVDLNNNKTIKRLLDLYLSVNISDDGVSQTIKNIAYVDGSASMRLVPTVLLIDNFSNSKSSQVLFGRGAGQSVPFFSTFYKGEVTVLGFFSLLHL